MSLRLDDLKEGDFQFSLNDGKYYIVKNGQWTQLTDKKVILEKLKKYDK